MAKLTAEERATMRAEHHQKYEDLAQQIGIEELVAILPVSRERITEALNGDDHYLNTIPLKLWDLAAGADKYRLCHGDYRLTFKAPFTPANASGLSLCDRVCVLKHVARNH